MMIFMSKQFCFKYLNFDAKNDIVLLVKKIHFWRENSNMLTLHIKVARFACNIENKIFNTKVSLVFKIQVTLKDNLLGNFACLQKTAVK